MTKTTDYSGSGLIHIKNQHLDLMEENVLYHLDLGTKTRNLPAMFGDIKFVCVGSSPNRMRAFAQFMHKELGLAAWDGHPFHFHHASGGTNQTAAPCKMLKRYYDTHQYFWRLRDRGWVCCDHGHGGGLLLPAMVELVVLGDMVVWSTELDKDLVGELLACSKEIPDLPTLVGRTMCSYDFYKGQGRLDGALCSFSSEKKLKYLKRAYDACVRNTEMESSVFAALCGLKGQCFKAQMREVVCMVLLDWLEGDQIRAPREEVLREYQQRPQHLIAAFIRKHLG